MHALSTFITAFPGHKSISTFVENDRHKLNIFFSVCGFGFVSLFRGFGGYISFCFVFLLNEFVGKQ